MRAPSNRFDSFKIKLSKIIKNPWKISLPLGIFTKEPSTETNGSVSRTAIKGPLLMSFQQHYKQSPARIRLDDVLKYPPKGVLIRIFSLITPSFLCDLAVAVITYDIPKLKLSRSLLVYKISVKYISKP